MTDQDKQRIIEVCKSVYGACDHKDRVDCSEIVAEALSRECFASELEKIGIEKWCNNCSALSSIPRQNKPNIQELLNYTCKITKEAGYDLNDSFWSHASNNNPFYEHLTLKINEFIGVPPSEPIEKEEVDFKLRNILREYAIKNIQMAEDPKYDSHKEWIKREAQDTDWAMYEIKKILNTTRGK